MFQTNKLHTRDYLKLIGVPDMPPLTSPFDPGYDPATLESHLEQSSHLMAILKVSMACWTVADEDATRRKLASARMYRVPTVAGGGPFEIAVAQNRFPAYLDLCADIGFTRRERSIEDHGPDHRIDNGTKTRGHRPSADEYTVAEMALVMVSCRKGRAGARSADADTDGSQPRVATM